MNDKQELKPCKNEDVELWREKVGDFYSPSIHVTKEGCIAICVAGSVIVKPIREIHEAISTRPAPVEAESEAEAKDGFSQSDLAALSSECDNAIYQTEKERDSFKRQLAETEASESQLMTERDQREHQITEAYIALGGTDEWSNLHDLGEDLIELITASQQREAGLVKAMEQVQKLLENDKFFSRNLDVSCQSVISKALLTGKPKKHDVEVIDSHHVECKNCGEVLHVIEQRWDLADREPCLALASTGAIKSTPECRKGCDVYKAWLKEGDKPTGASGWISVEDRLPEKKDKGNRSEWVLVTGTGQRWSNAHYNHMTQGWFVDIKAVGTPTHWMPIPPLPDTSDRHPVSIALEKDAIQESLKPIILPDTSEGE